MAPGRVAFRVDASSKIGAGHVMRCLALAEALRERGAELRFICRALDGNWADVIRVHGYAVELLPTQRGTGSAGNGTAHADWLETSADADAAQTRSVIDALGGVEWLVVDHYALDAAWHRRMRPAARAIFVIDDLADRALDADTVLDPVPDSFERYLAVAPKHARLLLGPRYALLRPEFTAQRAQLRSRSGDVRHLFVSFGGVDATGETTCVLDALELLVDDNVTADIVVGRSNAQADALHARCTRLRGVRFHHAVPNIAELMAAADLGIGAGGVTAWERVCLGLPAIVVAVAANQQPVARALAKSGAAVALNAGKLTPQRLADTLLELCSQPQRVREMARRCLALADGRGAARVARLLCPPPITLRRAVAADSDALLRWRNDQNVRRISLDSAEISRVRHERWLAAVLADPNRLLMVAEHAGRPVGVLRYDVQNAEAFVSIHLVSGESGHGFGPAILQAGGARLAMEHPGVRLINAQIKPDNVNSHHAFKEAGYRLEGSFYRQHLRS